MAFTLRRLNQPPAAAVVIQIMSRLIETFKKCAFLTIRGPGSINNRSSFLDMPKGNNILFLFWGEACHQRCHVRQDIEVPNQSKPSESNASLSGRQRGSLRAALTSQRNCVYERKRDTWMHQWNRERFLWDNGICWSHRGCSFRIIGGTFRQTNT